MRLAEAVAGLLVHRRRWVLAAAVALVAVAAVVLILRARFASDILDLLPGKFDSVQTFKKFDREFSQAHELTFAVLDETGAVDLDAFVDHLGAELRNQPWVERVLDRSPMESPQGLEDIPKLATPLLLNLEAGDFEQALANLKPEAIRARMGRLREEIEAGSPKAEFTLEFDPLGVVTPALKPLAGSFSVEQSRPLASPDGTMRLVIVSTREHDLDAHSCQAVMRDVDAFLESLRGTWADAMPQVMVTGRTAYVAELSQKMRNDVIATLASSILLVTLVFWLGFRSLRPLFAIVHVLLACCVVAAAIGAIVFGELNMVTIGLCAILIGLGVDFGMVLLGIYQAERGHGLDHQSAIASALRQHATAVIFGALTTAAAFLCLLLSESPGFMQLGLLIAAGILVAGALMMTVFFAMLGTREAPRRSDLLAALGSRLVERSQTNPRWLIAISGGVLLAACAVLALPLGELRFDANPRSLEPRNSRAGTALREIQRRMPVAAEPILVLLEAANPQERHDQWQRAMATWRPQIESGLLKSVNAPAAFAVSPERTAANAQRLAGLQFDAAEEALRSSAADHGFSEEAIRLGLTLLAQLRQASEGKVELDWRTLLPVESSWRFVLDRFFGGNPLVSLGYVTPARPLDEPGVVAEVRKAVAVEGVQEHLAGWSYMMTDLLPWARGKLVTLTSLILLLNFLLLAVLFRRAAPLAMTLLMLLLSLAATFGTLKLFGIGLNMFNALAFCLILGVGVDYSIYIAMAARGPEPQREMKAIFKPVLLSGLTTMAGFGSLATAENPALRSLGLVCAIGVGWALFAALALLLPASLCWNRR